MAVISAFTSTLSRMLTTPPAPDSANGLAVAVSGGSDSIALTLLLHSYCQQHSLPLHALTVDHGLRPESATEAAQVGVWMQQYGIPHSVLVWQHQALPVSGNLQALARENRYRLLTDYCRAHGITALSLGHTQDDQAETIALRQQRQAGPVGLSGMSARLTKHGVTLLRPLLGISRSALRDYLQAQGQCWIDDPSNDNADFDRIRIRQHLAAQPEEKQDLLALGRSMAAERLALEAAANQWLLQPEYIRTELPSGLRITRSALTAQEEALGCYLLGRMLTTIGQTAYAPRYAPLQQLWHRITRQDSGAATLNHCQLRWQEGQLLILPEGRPGIRAIYANPLVAEPFFPI